MRIHDQLPNKNAFQRTEAAQRTRIAILFTEKRLALYPTLLASAGSFFRKPRRREHSDFVTDDLRERAECVNLSEAEVHRLAEETRQ